MATTTTRQYKKRQRRRLSQRRRQRQRLRQDHRRQDTLPHKTRRDHHKTRGGRGEHIRFRNMHRLIITRKDPKRQHKTTQDRDINNTMKNAPPFQVHQCLRTSRKDKDKSKDKGMSCLVLLSRQRTLQIGFIDRGPSRRSWTCVLKKGLIKLETRRDKDKTKDKDGTKVKTWDETRQRQKD